jgi:hypothetical protein
MEKVLGKKAEPILAEEETRVSEAMKAALKEPDPDFSAALTEVFA